MAAAVFKFGSQAWVAGIAGVLVAGCQLIPGQGTVEAKVQPPQAPAQQDSAQQAPDQSPSEPSKSSFLGASLESTSRGIAFSRDPEVFFLPSGASKPVPVGRGSRAVLDPTGTKIAFLSMPKGTADPLWISVASADGSGSRVVYRSKKRLGDLQWSSQGDFLFSVWDGSSEALNLLLSSGSGFSESPIEVARTGQNGANGVWGPRWAPDGGSVIFQDMTNLFQVSLSGAVIDKTPIQSITGKANSVDSTSVFSISPLDPDLLAYTSAVPGTKKFDDVMGGEPNSALFIYNKASKVRKRLSPPDMVCMEPAWTPDGKRIILGGYREPHYTQAYPFRIYSIMPDGSGLKELARGENPCP